MNALPVGPEQVATAELRARYFEDLERWGFDIPYNAFYAHPYDDVVGKLREAYVEFASEAHRRGYPACVQIQSTLCAGDRVGIEEAQYNVKNEPDRWDEKGFFASFASDAWKDYLKEITTIFVREYGYDSIVFEEPMYRVDIPGTKDRFHEKFTAAYPGVKYPVSRKETPEYLKVQEAKARMLVEFYADLVAHTKSVGAGRVGIMPWFFIPTVENTPEGTLNTSCDVNEIARIPELDFLVVRMQPGNIFFDVMRTGDEMQKSPKLYFTEVMAHGLGKEIIALNNPTDEHTDYPSCSLIPFEFFRDVTLASLAAAPNGFTRHWYGQNYGKDDAHMEVLTQAAACTSRLGQTVAPVAFVFSYSATRHAEPLTYETVFSHYWALAKEMAFEAHLPMLTFHAATLAESLAAHPEVKVLVFEEHFPLTVEQILVLRDWWEGDRRNAVIAFGSGVGFSADPDSPGPAPCAQAHPGLLEFIGLRQEPEQQIVLGKPVELRDVSRVRRKAFLQNTPIGGLTRIANVRRIFGSRATVLYEAALGDVAIPVVAEYRDRSTLAVFCGFGLSHETAAAAARAIRFAMAECGCPPPVVDSCSDGILWSVNRHDYLVLANISDDPGRARVAIGRANLWDCREQKELVGEEPLLEMEPHSFRLYRVVGRRSKFLDVLGASCLRRLVDGAGRAEVDLVAGRETVLVLRNSPKEILVDGRHSTITQEVKNGAYHVTLQQCPPGERRIELRW